MLTWNPEDPWLLSQLDKNTPCLKHKALLDDLLSWWSPDLRLRVMKGYHTAFGHQKSQEEKNSEWFKACVKEMSAAQTAKTWPLWAFLLKETDRLLQEALPTLKDDETSLQLGFLLLPWLTEKYKFLSKEDEQVWMKHSYWDHPKHVRSWRRVLDKMVGAHDLHMSRSEHWL